MRSPLEIEAGPLARRRQLDGLRCLAFLAVFAGHVPGGWRLGGAIGVYTFFALSGFLITRILILDADNSLGRKLGRFYIRRLLRIFPLYYLTLGWLWAIGALPHAEWYFLYSSNILVFREQNFDPAIGHFWTLAVEEWFYILYPVTMLTVKPRIRLLLGLLVVSKISRAILAYFTPAPWYAVLLNSCSEYLLWGSLAALWERENRSLPLPGIIYAGLGTVMIAVYYYFRGAPAMPAPWIQLALDGTPDGIGFALIVLGLWRDGEAWFAKVLALVPLAYLGRISYGLYVYHIPVMQGPIGTIIHGSFGFGESETWRAWLIDLPVTIAVAAFSWQLFEQPVMRLRERFAYRYG